LLVGHAEDAPHDDARGPGATDDEARDALPVAAAGRSRAGGRRGKRRRCRGDGYGDGPEHDRLAPVLLSLVEDDRLGERRLTRDVERELMAAWIERERASVEVIGDGLPIHGHVHCGELVAGGSLHREYDGRDGCVELAHPVQALLAHLRRTAGRGASERLDSRRAQLVIGPKLE